MLNLDAVLPVLGRSLEPLADLVEEIGQAGVELDVGPQFPQHLIVETREPATPHVGEDVMQIEDVGPDEVGAALAIEVGKGVDFAPELDGIDIEPVEQRSLHVAGDQGSIEIPDESDRALGEECAGHHQ